MIGIVLSLRYTSINLLIKPKNSNITQASNNRYHDTVQQLHGHQRTRKMWFKPTLHKLLNKQVLPFYVDTQQKQL